jgi:hypothetical protein
LYWTTSQAQAQLGDAQLQQLRNSTPAKFQQQLLAPNISIWCYAVDPNQRWKIYLPDALLECAIRWYHLALSHIGVFHRNMVMNIPMMLDLTLVQQNRQRLIDQRLIKSNRKCFSYDYK